MEEYKATNTEKCITCHFFRANHSEKEWGECVKNAPVGVPVSGVTSQENCTFLARFPEISTEDFCGEYKRSKTISSNF